MSASIRLSGHDIVIQPQQPLRGADLQRFVRRAFAEPALSCLRIEDRALRLSLEGPIQGPEGALERLARHLVEEPRKAPEIAAQGVRPGVTLRRVGKVVTQLAIDVSRPKQTRVLLPKGAPEVVSAVEGLDGLIGVRRRPLSRVLIIDHAVTLDRDGLIETLERAISPSGSQARPLLAPVPFLAANTNLALCTTGQFFFPPAIPWVSTVLVLTRIPHLRHAARELRSGKVGAPFFGGVVLACSVAALSPFASALAEWLGCVWERRWRRGVERESVLLSQELKRVQGRLPEGTRFVLRTGAIAPVDGVLESGLLLVQDSLQDPLQTPRRRLIPGMRIESGDRVIGGEAQILIQNHGQTSRLERVIETIEAVPSTLPKDPVLTAESRRAADRAVFPNLVLAGVAGSVGGLHMASAILHQDWTTGPLIVAPTEFFHDVRAGLRSGMLIQSPSALKALARTDVLLMDLEHPELRETALRVSDIEAPGKETLRIHGYAHLLAEWVGDARGPALADLARISTPQGTSVEFHGVQDGRLVLRLDGRRIGLRDLEPTAPLKGLVLEVEDELPETLHFEGTDRPLAAPTFEALKALGVAVILVGGQGADSRDRGLGRTLGAAAVHPGLAGDALDRLIERLESEGRTLAFLGHGAQPSRPNDQRHLQILPLDAPLNGLSLGLLGGGLSALPGAIMASRTLSLRVGLSALPTLPTNLLCIVGGFAGRVNGTLATVLSNLGVLGVSMAQDRRLRRSSAWPALRSRGLAKVG